MRKILIAILCCQSIWSGALAADEEATAFSYESVMDQSGSPADATELSPPQPSSGGLVVLMADSGKNISDMNSTLYSAVADFGAAGLKIGEVVRFSAPSPEWVLKAIQIMGWSGFNNTTGRFPAERNFLIEVRDDHGDLLYKFADSQNFYFASSTGPVVYKMDIPPIKVPEVFYVAFYDRGSMFIGAELDNGTGNSFFIINGQLVPAETQIIGTNETAKINWLIRAIGE